MTQAKERKLACGGKGPCCHIGYAHRHCEHCDVVIATAPAWVYPWINPAPLQPYTPYWTNGTYTMINSECVPQQATGLAQVLEASWKSGSDSSPHLCEVK